MMNPLYNNRTYYIHDAGVFDKMLRDIAYDGYNTQETKEFANTRIVLTDASAKAWGFGSQNVIDVEQLIKAINEQDANMINDVYDSKYYLFLKDEMKKVKEQFKTDCVGTRRAVFGFPATHCFDSIQVMIRDGAVLITVNMRSCNAYKNLICDIYLAYRLACEATHDWVRGEKHLIANIGSLHLFKEDVAHVL